MNNESLFLETQTFMTGIFERFSVEGMKICFAKDMNVLKSPTNICMSDLDNEVIYVNDIFDYTVNPQFLFFNLAHEARHVYQWRKGILIKDFGYIFPDCTSEKVMENYRLQPEEVDANAFPLMEMERVYGNNLEYGFSEAVMEKINSRICWIRENEVFSLRKN